MSLENWTSVSVVLFGATLIVGILLAMVLIQNKKRYAKIRTSHGVDMHGIDEIVGFKQQILWIRSRPDFTKNMDAYKILFDWERREAKLNELNS